MICKAWPHTKPPSSKLINNHVLSNNIGSKTSINHRHVICLVLCPCDILCLLWVYVYVLFIYYIPCLFLFDFLFCYCGFVYVGRNLRENYRVSRWVTFIFEMNTVIMTFTSAWDVYLCFDLHALCVNDGNFTPQLTQKKTSRHRRSIDTHKT